MLVEDSSTDAYDMVYDQIQDLIEDMDINVAMLGFVVNMYDSRKGDVATWSLNEWQNIGESLAIAIVPELTDQRETVRVKQPLLGYAPYGDRSEATASADMTFPRPVGGADQLVRAG